MPLFFSNAPSWFMLSLLAIPLAIILSARGINILIKGKSKVVNRIVVVSMIFSFLIAACFVIFDREIPEIFLYLTFPFGVLGMFLVTVNKSIPFLTVGFLLGVFLNACAFGSSIEFAGKLWSWRKQELK